MTTKFPLMGVTVCLIIFGFRPAPRDFGVAWAAPTTSTKHAPQGYLTAGKMPDSALFLGPPPPNGSGTKAGDVATYRATRILEGTPRWQLATRDAEFGPEPMMKELSCAFGKKLNRTSAPQLFHLLSRVVEDSETIENNAKQAYKRPRPFVENGGPICVAKEKWLTTSYSYPSGHSTFGWVTGMILGDIAPDRASETLARARSFGESRVICGAHYESDVQAGRITASVLFTALQNSQAFRDDLEGARTEIGNLPESSPTISNTSECKIETSAAANPAW